MGPCFSMSCWWRLVTNGNCHYLCRFTLLMNSTRTRTCPVTARDDRMQMRAEFAGKFHFSQALARLPLCLSQHPPRMPFLLRCRLVFSKPFVPLILLFSCAKGVLQGMCIALLSALMV